MVKIQKDAGEIMALIYKEYVKDYGRQMDTRELSEETNWGVQRVNRAVKYLSDNKLIETIAYADGSFSIMGVLPKGIDIVENKGKFKKTFGFTINLLLFKFSWEQEKK